MELVSVDISLPPNVRMYFTKRDGGVSDPPFSSLNMSVYVGDDLAAVYENRMRLADVLPTEPMWLRQAHGNRVLLADTVQRDVDVADAAHTTTPDVVCAIQTADCLPVLFFHEDGRGVGAAHAGWRGLVAGVIEKTAAAMQAQNTSPLYACIGPGISAPHYLVGAEVYQQLCSSPADAEAFTAHPHEQEKWYADLAQLAKHRLLVAGVRQVHTVELCTYARKDLFFSARRDNGQTGRQVGVIYYSS